MFFSKISLLIALAMGHGAMKIPVPRNFKMTNTTEIKSNPSEGEHLVVKQTDVGCEGYACLWFSQGCTPGCEKCSGVNQNTDTPQCELPKDFKPWITWDKQEYMTYPNTAAKDFTKYTPWRSPGEAPVMNSCGMAAGTPKTNKQAAGFAPPGKKNGDLGTDLPATNSTKWYIGEPAEVAFGLWANHGGGYQYRLCPADSTLDEECFKKLPLEFVNGTSTFYWEEGPSKGKEVQIDATLVKARDGSMWAKNPIPAYGCATGGVETGPGGLNLTNSGCTGPQFTPLIQDSPEGQYWGFSNYVLGTGERKKDTFLPYVKDHVKVPNVKPGHYVLSWRWDSEQGAQVWNQCSDIEIVHNDKTLLI